MVEPKRKINVLAAGETGVGKSTFLNLLADKTHFRAQGGTNSVTQDVSDGYEITYGEYQLNLIDCPGFNDPNMSVPLLHSKIRAKVEKVDLILFIAKADRMGESVLQSATLLKEFFEGFRSSSVVIVITRCDRLEQDDPQEQYGEGLQQLLKTKCAWVDVRGFVYSNKTSEKARNSLLPLLSGTFPNLQPKKDPDFSKIFESFQHYGGFEDYVKRQIEASRKDMEDKLVKQNQENVEKQAKWMKILSVIETGGKLFALYKQTTRNSQASSLGDPLWEEY